MTTIHPTPVWWLQARSHLARPVSGSTAEVSRLFFEPTTDGVTSHAESASQATQTASFFVCAKDFLALLLRVTVRLRVIATTAATVITVITLFAISGLAIADNIVTTAMATL
jgi:hypothetical protein